LFIRPIYIKKALRQWFFKKGLYGSGGRSPNGSVNKFPGRRKRLRALQYGGFDQ